MIFVRVIDENGMFIEDAFVEELTEFTIETPCPQGFYKPKWDGNEWIEGLTQGEIDLIKNQPIESSEIEKLKIRQDATEDALLFIMEMGVM